MFEGVYTALVTPFQENGKIDVENLKSLVDWQIDEGIHGLVPMGTTGESPTLSHPEHIEVVRLVLEQARGRVPIIAGAGSNSTAEAVNLSRQAKDLGAAATLQVAPYYNKPTQEGLYRHYWKIAEEVDLPLIIYNIPGRCGVQISNETLLRLAEHKNIVGLKEATGDLGGAMEFILQKPEDFAVLSGDDNMTFPLVSVGGKGVISVASNFVPKDMVEFVEKAVRGEVEEARKSHYRLLPLFKALFIETNPIPVKAAMSMKGLLKEVYRLPMCPMQEGNKKKLEGVIKDLGII
jgi:4-hydroxy-tetrahydrodipicolinate synthase